MMTVDVLLQTELRSVCEEYDEQNVFLFTAKKVYTLPEVVYFVYNDHRVSTVIL